MRTLARSHMALFEDLVLVVKTVNLPPIWWPLCAMSCSRLSLSATLANDFLMMGNNFVKLNLDWNAEPNAPIPKVMIDSNDLFLSFYLNYFQFNEFAENDIGILKFKNISRYRLGGANDEGWYKGNCRFSSLAPRWGEFYLVSVDNKLGLEPTDWKVITESVHHKQHYLFYFKDSTFECFSDSCEIKKSNDNALFAHGKVL